MAAMAGRRRWAILAVGTFAQAATCCFLYGMPMLVPTLRAGGQRGGRLGHQHVGQHMREV